MVSKIFLVGAVSFCCFLGCFLVPVATATFARPSSFARIRRRRDRVLACLRRRPNGLVREYPRVLPETGLRVDSAPLAVSPASPDPLDPINRRAIPAPAHQAMFPYLNSASKTCLFSVCSASVQRLFSMHTVCLYTTFFWPGVRDFPPYNQPLRGPVRTRETAKRLI